MKRFLLLIFGIVLVAQIFECESILNDEELFDYQHGSGRAETRIPPHSYNSYMSFKQMERRLKSIESNNRDKVKLESVGYSEEGNTIYLVTITDQLKRAAVGENSPRVESSIGSHRGNRRLPFVYLPPGSFDDTEIYNETDDEIVQNTRTSSGRPIIFVDAGIHAREWVAPAAAFYLIDKLLETPSLTDYLEWKIMPMVNPDGYIYSRISSSTRYWRKNRARTKGHPNCVGVDLNRNFDLNWKDTNQNACSDTYSGSRAFSEPESRAIRTVLNNYKHRIQAYVTIHTYGQLFLYPYGYTSETSPPNVQKLRNMGNGMSNAIYKMYRNKYLVRQASAIGAASGGSDDWAFMKAKIPYSYTFELQSKVESFSFRLKGFNLPAHKLLRAVDECWIALNYMANKILTDLQVTRTQLVPDIQQSAGVATFQDHYNKSEEESTEDASAIAGVVRSNLPELIWDQIRGYRNVAKYSIHQKREISNKKDCQIIDSMYICPHMVFWNSMFHSPTKS